MNKQQPTPSDLTELVEVLNKHDVSYLVIGGIAMTLHGFPRATKDTDLLLPVSAENNEKLLNAFSEIGRFVSELPSLPIDSLNKGYFAANEADINVDLLFVAASKTYDELFQHLAIIEFNGLAINTLNLDGMIDSKNTNRDIDKSDKRKLFNLQEKLRKQTKANEKHSSNTTRSKPI